MPEVLSVLLGLATIVSGPVEDLRTSAIISTLRDGTVTALKDTVTGEGFAAEGPCPLAGLRRLKDRHLWSESATVAGKSTERGTVFTATWREGAGESHLVTRFEPQPDGSLLVNQSGRSAAPGLVGVQWGLVLPDYWQVLVPGWSGQRFSADTPAHGLQFTYPIEWEAQFILIQGQRGGVLVFAEDNAERFKALHLDHEPGRFLIGFETRCTAPFESQVETGSVRWRVRTYQGDWLVGAGIYRGWAEKAFGLTRIAERRPSWVKDIQFVVITDLRDAAALKALARNVEPRRTLLYVPGWRRSGYDYNYPDYAAIDGFDAQMKQAHDLGFRVMLHVNYFGCTPENPAYEQLKSYHCLDPMTKALLYWDWPRANPPIKFAYIDPGARAWRELFVRRMTELCAQYHPDALHLDQTLCIWNDGRGPIDGMNMMQGSLALHLEVRQALPDVALSGEGLNEITCRYESFAQRHVYGINHVDMTWNDRLITMSHPVSSSLLANYTTIYGYLGMPNPEPSDYYFAWRSAYERFGVVPTYGWPRLKQLESPPAVLQMLLGEARWFQHNTPVPDFSPNWDRQTLFAYRAADGRRAEYRRDDAGIVLAVRNAGVAPSANWQVVSRRITGVSAAAVPGQIPGWRAHDDQRILGLNPRSSYAYLDEPRDPNALHICSLPDDTTVRRVGLRSEFAAIALDDTKLNVASLWEAAVPTRSGERLCNGVTHQANGPMFHSDTGTTVEAQGDGIFAHPPWRAEFVDTKGVTPSCGLGCSWIEFDLRLPSDRPAHFEAAVGLRSEEASRNSDGVTFRAVARLGLQAGDAGDAPKAPLFVERHTKQSVPEPLALDLSRFRGRPITLRLEADPGPAGNVSFDWALWTRPRVVLAGRRFVRIGLVSPRPVVDVVPRTTRDRPAAAIRNQYKLEMEVPGSLYVLFRQPQAVRPPAELWTLPFSNALVLRDGQEAPPTEFMRAGPATSTVGGITRQGVFAHPPPQGQNHVDFLISLPAQPLCLIGFVGIRDGAEGKSSGVGFRITVNGQEQWRADMKPDGKWLPFDVSLSKYAGQTVVLTLITDALGDYICDWAHWGEPRLVPLF
jgi:hypothetical protein